MFGKFLIFSLATGGLISCAQPKYAPHSIPNTPHQDDLCSHSFTRSGYCLLWNWNLEPTDTTYGSLELKIFYVSTENQTLVPVDPDDEVSLLLWMPSMGHGSTPTTVQRTDTGHFLFSNIFFIMPGEWELKFQLKSGSSVTDEVIISLTR